MSEIKAGDLVMVVHSEAGNEGKIGSAVQHLGVSTVDGTFRACDRWLVRFPRPISCGWGDAYNPAAIRTAWLKRLDPPALSESTKHSEEIPA